MKKKTTKGPRTNQYGELKGTSRKVRGSTPLTPALERQLRKDMLDREIGQIINRATSDMLDLLRAAAPSEVKAALKRQRAK